MEDEHIEEEKEEDLKEVKEDAVVSSSEFRQWKCLSKATHGALELLCELVALASSEDEEFEEVSDEEEGM